uniref:Chloride intracellular channel protein 5-like n=1 Tax=Phallusia mammillata TaxID=59560 RepID=A0A6F9DA51_9ASCI|nr:chloride intracellular channel protein 5-like [Phallusia mammillata]
MADTMENIYDEVAEGVGSEYVNDNTAEAADIPNSEVDYIHHYETEAQPEADLPQPPEHLYEFETHSSASSASGKEEAPKSPVGIASMAELVVQGIENLKTEDKPEKDNAVVVNGNGACADSVSSNKRPDPQIALFVKAGSDRECIGCCPFSQRLFMILWLKGVVFNVTTVDKATKPKQLKDVAPGTNPPFLLFNGEELTDIQKCEDYIEAELYPPRYPKLACKHQQSKTTGNDVFAKFSAFIKFRGNVNDPKRKDLENKLNVSLRKFNAYLNEPLDDEIDEDDDSDEAQISKRKFIDGNTMTIADCVMLPKLHILRVACKGMLNYEIPEEFTGIHRYLANADNADEFLQTCASDDEIIWAYGGRRKPKK